MTPLRINKIRKWAEATTSDMKKALDDALPFVTSAERFTAACKDKAVMQNNKDSNLTSADIKLMIATGQWEQCNGPLRFGKSWTETEHKPSGSRRRLIYWPE